MERDAHYTMVGLFVVIMLAAGFFSISLLTGSPYQQSRQLYQVYFDSAVDGLIVGSEVRYMGMKVGEVTSLGLLTPPIDNKRVFATIQVNANTPIDTATMATLRTQALTGIAFIGLAQQQITQELSQPLQSDNNMPPVIPAQQSELNTIIERLPHLEEKLDTLLNAAGDLLNAENRGHFTRLLANLGDSSEVAPDLLASLQHNNQRIGKVIDSLPAVTEQLEQVLSASNQLLNAQNQAQFANLLHNLSDASEGIPGLVSSFQANSAQLGGVMQGMDMTLAEVTALINHVDQAVGEMRTTLWHADNSIIRLDNELQNSLLALQTTLNSMTETSRYMGQLSTNVNRIVLNNESQMNELLGQGSADLQQLLRETQQAMQSVRYLSDELTRNPSQIIYQPPAAGVVLPR